MPRRLEKHEERQQFRAYLEGVFSRPDAKSIVEYLRELNPPETYRIRLKLIYTAGNPALHFRTLGGGFKTKPLSPSGASYMLLKDEDGEPKQITPFAVLPTEQPHTYVVAAVAQRDDWITLLRGLRRGYPFIVPIYLSQKELLQGIIALQRRVTGRFELRVREISAKERLDDGRGQWLRSVREWTLEQLDQTLQHVSARRQIISSITFAFHRMLGELTDVSPAATCRVTKASEVEFTGRYDLLWDTVVAHIANVGEAKLTFYAHRGLRERDFKPAPLAIEYAAPVFAEAKEIQRLVDVLRRYPRSMHSVPHGNPYAYVQVTDSFDGSAFDVWALSPERIAIIPRLKASQAGIGRLIQYLFEEFREGAVVEYGNK